ncbi:unnamed protein product [Mucor hiemalis]
MNNSTSFIQELNSTDFLDSKSFPFSDFENDLLSTTESFQKKEQLLTQQQQQQTLSYNNNVTTPSSPTPLTGVYSNTGFDMIQILSRLQHRPNPQIQLGPIDLSCAFVVSDARGYDIPVIYCSPAFERLTGYTNEEIVGKNCRFLQSPDGQVTCGSRRQHTDNQAVYHLKAQLMQGKEHQASIINYRKGGQPFVNLVTVIPILGDTGEVEYYVGLQVDLVEQPNSILEKMKDGTYMVNYHQSSYNYSSNSNNLLMDSSSTLDEYFREIPTNNSFVAQSTSNIIQFLDTPQQMDIQNNEQQMQKEWNKVLLDQCCDFVHVLSLKGVFLYVSNSSVDMLEYEPDELIGNSLSSICHPSDIIPVMREIKEATADPDKSINLVFRIRRRASGYIWIDCRGKLHMDQSKGRKCLILSGRERPVYKLLDTQISNDVAEEEYWGKLSMNGLYLYVTPTCKNVVGFTFDSLEHESIYQYVENSAVTEITRALNNVKEGEISRVRHTILNSKGSYVPVLSTFYPGDTVYKIGQPSFVLLQVKLLKNDSPPSPINSTHVLEGENIFPELETVRTTNWQYELHQLQQSNKRLREQLERVSNTNKQKKKVIHQKFVCFDFKS